MYRVLTILLILCDPFTLLSQTVYPDYEDGRIWVKLRKAPDSITLLPGQQKLVRLPDRSLRPGLEKNFGLKSTAAPFMNIRRESPLRLTYLLSFDDFHKVDTLIAELGRNPLIEYAEKVPLVKHFSASGHGMPDEMSAVPSMLTPDDPGYASQWYLPHIGAASAWNYFSAASQVVIAVIDDAVDRSHPDLAPNLWTNPREVPGNGRDDDGNGYIDDINGWDFADGDNTPDPPSGFSHGTHVAGIAAAATHNGTGIAGLGFSCKIMCIKATKSAGAISHGYAGIIYAADNGAHIINCSWGGTSQSATSANIIRYAQERGAIVVAAAGNDNQQTPFYPAGYAGVVSVASTTADDTKSSLSNYGPWIKVSAPGSNIYSTLPGNAYGYKSGTSMAAPLVSGLLGLMRSFNPSIQSDELLACLYSTAVPLDTLNPAYSGQLGAGRIDAAAAMQCIHETLYREPVADFKANRQVIHAGASVNFTSLSGFSPTQWEWEFEGGTPASFSGETPPAVYYHTPGTYNVRLTVSNAFGSHTADRTGYIIVNNPISCATPNFPVPEAWQLRDYHVGNVVGANGWVNGVSIFHDLEKAMFFDASAYDATHLTGAMVTFGKAYSQTPSKTVPVRIYDGSSGYPGSELGTATLTMEEIMADVAGKRSSTMFFHPAVALPGSKKIFVSVDISQLGWPTGGIKDTLSIKSNTNGQTTPSAIWEKQQNGQWYQYGASGSWNLAASLLIHPTLTANPPVLTFTTSGTTVCAGDAVDFDAAGSTYHHGIIWTCDGGIPSASTSVTPSFRFDSPGFYRVKLEVTGGGCAETRLDSVAITVLPAPQLEASLSKNPICEGESVVISLQGAQSYSWFPTDGLSARSDYEVTAAPVATTTYTVTGSVGSCTAAMPVQVEVRPPTASVALTASANDIPPGTEVSFTAIPENGGVNPVFDFRRNGFSVQSGEISVWTSGTLSNGDVIRCVMTTDEECVTSREVSSDEILIQVIGALPLQLVYFRISSTADGHLLYWKSEAETGFSHFVVERSSDAAGFQAIGNVAGNGGNIYTFMDRGIGGGRICYYRLRMTDLDGRYSFSPILVSSAASFTNVLEVFPNPVPAGVSAQVRIPRLEVPGETVILKLYNATGQAIRTYKVSSYGGLTFELPVGGLYGIHHLACFNTAGAIIGTARLLIRE